MRIKVKHASFWLDGEEIDHWHTTCTRCQWNLRLTSWRRSMDMAALHIETHALLGR